MSAAQLVVEILARAEADLRKAMEEAVQQGRYEDVATIARMAKAVANLATREQAQGVPEPVAASTPEPSEARGRRSSARMFPRFERDGEKLVKIAWSKRDRAEYEHRAPREIVDILIEAIRRRKGEGAKFQPADILPLKQKGTRREVPSYQSYLALAWLRHEGLVIKHGRDRYSLKSSLATEENVSQRWLALAQK